MRIARVRGRRCTPCKMVPVRDDGDDDDGEAADREGDDDDGDEEADSEDDGDGGDEERVDDVAG